MLWEVLSYGERPYWEMSNQDVSSATSLWQDNELLAVRGSKARREQVAKHNLILDHLNVFMHPGKACSTPHRDITEAVPELAEEISDLTN